MPATRVPREDHRLISAVLDCFEDLLGRLHEEPRERVSSFAPYVEFFQDFVEGCHAEVEEVLYDALGRAGLGGEGTPVAAILQEHGAWDEILGDLSCAVDGGDLRTAAAAGAAFAAFLRRHAAKEEHCVFPALDRALEGGLLEEVSAHLDRVLADGDHAFARAHGEAVATRILAEHGVTRGPAAPSLPPVDPQGPARPRSGWRLVGLRSPVANNPELTRLVTQALRSPAMAVQVSRLLPLGLRPDPEPMLWSFLPEKKLRLFFPVRRNRPLGRFAVEEGEIVALVLLHDMATSETLYVHPVHAGPGTNPLLRHVEAPMAKPHAQAGDNGARATRRLLEHKAAIWAAFEEERKILGEDEAGRRWRERYEFALLRLYFCERCTGCAWGSPFLDGLGPRAEALSSSPGRSAPGALRLLAADLLPGTVERVRESLAFRIERAYARRGGFTILEEACLGVALDDDWVVVGFPSDAEWIEAGTIAGLIAHHHLPSQETRYAQCLVAGPDAEITLASPRPLLDLPAAGTAARRRAYAAGRRTAWQRFWLVELEEGLRAASAAWRRDLWKALYDLHAPEAPHRERESPRPLWTSAS